MGMKTAPGQKRTLRRIQSMSALPSKADIRSRARDVRFVPIADVSGYSINSSARPSSGSGIVRLSVLASLRLIANSIFVTCSTGRSAAFSPLRMRPVLIPTSRRTLVTSAAALPALAVPALAAMASPIPAPVPITPDVPQLDDELLFKLGEQLKPLLVELQRVRVPCHAAYEQAFEAAGFDKFPPGTRTEKQQAACRARFKAAAKKNGYSKLMDQLDRVHPKAFRIAKRILKIEPTDRIGDGIHAAAALVLDEPSYMEYAAGTVLRQMAARAGFSIAADREEA
jgi:hypothetical protein